MVAVVIGAAADVAVEADRALTGPRSVGDDQALAALFATPAESRREAAAVLGREIRRPLTVGDSSVRGWWRSKCL